MKIKLAKMILNKAGCKVKKIYNDNYGYTGWRVEFPALTKIREIELKNVDELIEFALEYK